MALCYDPTGPSASASISVTVNAGKDSRFVLMLRIPQVLIIQLHILS